jgi:hypothetical protein
MTISHLYPNSKPSLVLNFARAKKLDSRISFERGTTATRMNPQGILETVGIGNPRFEHIYDPPSNSTTCVGLLLEDTGTNLLTFSEQFDNASWTKTNTSIGIGSATAPNGLTTAYSVTDNTTNGIHTVGKSFSATQTTTISCSCFARSGIGSTGFAVGLTLSGPLTSAAQVVVDLDTGVGITSLYGTNYVTFIQPYPNGWYRVGFAATATSTATATFTISMVKKSGSTGIFTYVGAGSTILVFGAQAEVAPAPSSYIPSGASSGIRSGDLAYIDLNSLPSWFNSSQGTLVFEHTPVGFSTTTSAGFPAIGFAATSGASTYAIQYWFDRSGNRNSAYLVRNNGVDISGINYFAPSGSTAFPAAKVGFAYTSNLFTLARNGSIVGTGAGTTVPSVGSLMIGNNTKNISANINASIAHIHYYPSALDSVYLQNLTKK